jgi:hypothetical protein
MFTNHKDFGGDFGKEFISNIKKYDSLEIASGYFGVALVNKIRDDLLAIAKRGYCRILVGMIFNEGVSKAQKQTLEDLNADLKNINPDSGVFVTIQQYHGKVYKFKKGHEEKIYVGSSNLSDSGFYDNYEFNAIIKDTDDKEFVNNFLNFLFKKKEISASLDDVELFVKSKRNLKTTKGKTSLKDFEIRKNQFPTAPFVSTQKIELRVDKQPNSSLNLYFEKGRKNKNGKYAPRPWYEVEITTEKTDREGININNYPIGDFTTFYQDGNKFYKLNMITASDNHKALTTKDNREILGELIKSKLTKLGHLQGYERITSETLANYGKNFITLSKIKNNEYYFDF